MATVPGEPYEPFSTVAPAERILRPGGVAPVPDAFGAGLARAVAVFGGDVERSGAQVFDTALQARKLQVETGVRDAVTDHYTKSAPVQADFLSAQGTNASNEALTGHLNQINSMRVAARAEVEKKFGAYGATLFDADTSAIQRSFVQQATQHSAREMKTAANTSMNAREDSIGDAVQSAPDNQDAYDDAIEDLRDLEIERGRLHGFTPDVIEENTNKEIAKLTAKRIIGTAIRGDDESAQKMLAQAIEDKTLRGDQADAVAQKIQTQAQRNFSYFRQIETYNKQQARDQAQQDVGKIVSQNVTTDDATGEVRINPNIYTQLTDFARRNPLASHLVDEKINWAQRQQDRIEKGITVRTHPDAMSALTGNMFSAQGATSERDIAVAESNGLLSTKDGKWLKGIVDLRDSGDKKAIADPFFKVAMTAAKNWIEGTDAISRQTNAGLYASFQYQFLQQYLNRVHEHKQEPGDLNIGDENSFIRKMIDQLVPGIATSVRNNGGVGSTAPSPTPTPTPPKGSEPKVVRNKADFDALKPGESFVDENGKPWKKPDAPSKKPEKPAASM